MIETYALPPTLHDDADGFTGFRGQGLPWWDKKRQSVLQCPACPQFGQSLGGGWGVGQFFSQWLVLPQSSCVVWALLHLWRRPQDSIWELAVLSITGSFYTAGPWGCWGPSCNILRISDLKQNLLVFISCFRLNLGSISRTLNKASPCKWTTPVLGTAMSKVLSMLKNLITYKVTDH